MDSKKLKELIKRRYGNLRDFSNAAELNYNTMYSAIREDAKLDNMNVSMFIAIAHALDMSVDGLILYLGGVANDPQ